MPGHNVGTLLAHLRTLEADRLATVMRGRPDSLDLPWPAHIEDLAQRLFSQESIIAAYYRLSLPHAEVLGALALVEKLGQPVTIDNVASWMDSDIATVRAFLADLVDLSLAWVTDDGVIATPYTFPIPGARLGSPVRALLEQAALSVLRPIAAKLAIRGDGSKAEVVDRLASYLGDADTVRALVDSAPAPERDVLLEMATTGAELEYFQLNFGSSRIRQAPHAGDWAVARGLLWPTPDGVASMPLEVGLGLRGERWRLPLHAEQPEVALQPIPTEHADADAAVHLLRLLELISILVDSAAGQLIPTIKSGAVGVQVQRALAKDHGADVDQIALAVALALAIGVLAPADPPAPKGRSRKRQVPLSPGLIPGPAAPTWGAADAQTRATDVLKVWWQSGETALLDPKRAVELRDSPVHASLRHNLLGVYAGFPLGQGVSAMTELAPILAWRAPLRNDESLDDVLYGVAKEATLLGAIALGGATAIGRGLVDGSLEAAIGELVSGAHTSALIGADLTAVVFGPPTTELSGFLDSVGRRESRGTATMWRFTPDSVRAAFDRGATAGELLDKLTAIAQAGVPQPLEYLINDVARTHGRLGVIDVGSAVVADDTVLLHELVGNRKLAKLGLFVLAPTVVVSRGDAATTLAALRGAGYSPVLRDTDGVVVVDGSASAKMEVAQDDVAELSLPDADPVRQARHLAATANHKRDKPAQAYEFIAALGEHGHHEALWALHAGDPVRITYAERTHLVHSARLVGDTLTAWSVTTDRFEDFPAANISITAWQ
ncbi:helicase-associated domain-containing protein [Antrihabitans sp. YC2-6]|uniref:helicase-associated domain-containing protein n=1 Tax=Antrihabitans sp. YC2-6 TaxID=2799498 RepID=UPI0018F6821A|nr:helicase-associated domain-containing protein [Antrihabitans sp. YC2-6]MBJ8343108.1 helicase-associated domain-containing protein [Antrihabitans sp. YC2-6]